MNMAYFSICFCHLQFLPTVSLAFQVQVFYIFSQIYSQVLYYYYYYFFKFYLFIYLSIYGCVGSSFPCEGLLQLWQAGATLHRGARAPHRHGLSRCGAQAPDAQAQQPWLTDPAAPRHAGSSQTRARTRVPCTGRQTPNHCATREALLFLMQL